MSTTTAFAAVASAPDDPFVFQEVELGPLGIRVNSIHPGVIDTSFNDIPELEDIDWEGITKALPLGRSGSPLEIARLAAFLCSSESSYSTGSEFVADGGILAGP